MNKLYLTILCIACFSLAGLWNVQAQSFDCPDGLDVHIANDVSGSVDSNEFSQAKNFVAQLAASFDNNFGVSNDQSRISISNWSNGTGRFVEYNFPSAGQNYTTSLADMLSYSTSARPFSGGTDVYTALLRANEWVDQNPISGRTAPKVIVLLTDASCGQVANNTSSIATQIKDRGVYIVVLAIDNAVGCDRLSTPADPDKVSSPGGYFEAADYAVLQQQTIGFIQSITQASCNNPPPASPQKYDLTVDLSNFTVTGCESTPTGSFDLSVTNSSTGENFNDNLRVSIYNGNPTVPSSQYLFTVNAGTQNITSNGGTYVQNSITNPSLAYSGTLYALVNYEGSAAGNEVPVSINNLGSNTFVSDESNVSNNLSAPISRVDSGNCSPYAVVQTKVTNTGQVCGNQIIYYVEVCNVGTADVDISQINPFPPSAYTFVSGPILVGSDPFVGNTLPASECVIYEYTYNLDNANSGTTYDFTVNVVEAP